MRIIMEQDEDFVILNLNLAFVVSLDHDDLLSVVDRLNLVNH